MTGRLSLLLLFPVLACAAPSASFVWVETPSSTNFPNTQRWSILSEGQAPGVTQVRDASLASSFFAEYVLDVPAPGGRFDLWGRSYDPNWSSPARWRIGDGPWTTWTPGPVADRQVAERTYAMQWHRWGEVELPPGPHRLRVELTGLRKRGDIPYFVLDALLLARGEFTPAGDARPDAVVRQRLEVIRAKAQPLGEAGAPLVAEAEALASRALESDLGALAELARVEAGIGRRLDVARIIEANKTGAIHGKVGAVVLEGRSLSIPVTWSRPLGDARVWIGFLQNRALYADRVVQAGARGREETYRLELPDALPAGHLTLEIVPIGEPTATAAAGSVTVPASAAGKPLARAWGVYRDKNLRAHPWSVTEGGMMTWDGAPFVPLGGMINTRLSWQTHKGDADNSTVIRSGVELLRAQFQELKRHGLSDVYFNAFFPRSDPLGLAAAVNVAEEEGMRYGLHISSNPARRSLGFHVAPPVSLAAGAREVTLRHTVGLDEVREEHRVIWAVFSERGVLLEKGRGLLRPDAASVDAKKRTTELVLRVEVGASAEARTVAFRPEVQVGRQDAVGYYAGLEDYIAQLREIYGSLSYGPGMRLWIDPFQNELHGRPNNVCSDPRFRTSYAHWLLDRYGSIEKLGAAWKQARGRLADIHQAARVVPLHQAGALFYAMDPETQEVFAFDDAGSSLLRDLKLFRGVVAERAISRVADVLKSIANVPVILKHNTWFNDWFINPEPAGGQDGMGFEPYCYGDSLAYHNSLVPMAQSLASARRQWAIVTETSAAAFDGQKDYVGYLDRLQMLHDFDQMLKFGAKGIYAFGFAFDPPRNFQVTELLRDPRQLEWLATYRRTVEAAAPGLAAYLPELHGWYPAYLREREILDQKPPAYAMHGNYTQRVAQIRMAPDGRWIVPAMRVDAGWKGLLAAPDLMTEREREAVARAPAGLPVWPVGGAANRVPLDGFTANGIGVIPAAERWATLDEFREAVLGYRVFQTEALNGQTLPDGRIMVWTAVERERAEVELPAGARAFDVAGKERSIEQSGGRGRLALVRPPYEQVKGDLPAYLRHLPGGYHHVDAGQPEVAILSGVSVEQILSRHAPAWHRWLPKTVTPAEVSAWQEAEAFVSTTFVQPRAEGYSRYSGGAAVGINTHFPPPRGQSWVARYAVRSGQSSSKIWIRRMDRPALDIEVVVNGRSAGVVPATEKPSDAMHLNPWNAGLGVNRMNVGWHVLALGQTLPAGEHRIELIARDGGFQSLKADTLLVGGQSDADTEAEAARIEGLRCVQIDAFMLTR